MASAKENVTGLNFGDRRVRLERVGKGALSVGIKTDKGVVIAADKTPPSRLYDVQSIRSVEVIAEHVGMVFSGLRPDYRILARKTAIVYQSRNQIIMPVDELVKELCTASLCG